MNSKLQFNEASPYLAKYDFEILNEKIITSLNRSPTDLERVLATSVKSVTLPSPTVLDTNTIQLGESVLAYPAFSTSAGELSVTFYEEDDMILTILFTYLLSLDRNIPSVNANISKTDIKLTITMIPNRDTLKSTKSKRLYYNQTLTYYLKMLKIEESEWDRSQEADLHTLTVYFSSIEKDIGP